MAQPVNDRVQIPFEIVGFSELPAHARVAAQLSLTTQRPIPNSPIAATISGLHALAQVTGSNLQSRGGKFALVVPGDRADGASTRLEAVPRVALAL